MGMDFLAMLFFLGILLFCGGLFIFFICAFVYNMGLYFYLMKNNYDRWCELTSIGNFGPGGSNPFKWFPYLYNQVDIDNKDILRYKNRVRFWLRASFFAFLGLIVQIVLLVFLIMLPQFNN
jgi:hypothetical protein